MVDTFRRCAGMYGVIVVIGYCQEELPQIPPLKKKHPFSFSDCGNSSHLSVKNLFLSYCLHPAPLLFHTSTRHLSLFPYSQVCNPDY